MESATTRAGSAGASGDRAANRGVVRRLSTETKQAFKTTEFWAMVGVIVGILVAAASIKGGDTTGTDEFIAKQAWLYVAIVAVGYMVSRGLAKSGSREPYEADRDDRDPARH
ncbi:MAG TPA: hypothetical protein VI039_00745 [Solirubrobacterales bacterium]